MEIELARIVQNPYQVRDISIDDELQELADSIKDNGLLQPIKVRPVDQGYELVYGHRRVAAMRLLGWTKCEAMVEEVADGNSLVQSLVENLQRQNLDILDEARSYQTLVERGYMLREIAELVKKPQGRISNRLSILRLPPQVQELVIARKGQHATTTERGGLSPDSASRIASAAKTPDEAIALAYKAVNERLNSKEIRELTSLLKEITNPSQRKQVIRVRWEIAAKEFEHSQDDQAVKPLSIHQVDPLNELFHRKIVWNLRRLDLKQFNHFTIGYSRRSLDQFIELLHLAQIELLADVRSVSLSRFRPEFSKLSLANSLVDRGIEYAHWSEFGIPTDVRRSLQAEALFAWYDSNAQLDLKLVQHSAELSSCRIAFMCTEVDPQSCHRHRIAVCLEQMGYRLLDL